MKRLVFVAFVFCGLTTKAQNLVSNPSFEEYSQCPWSLGGLEYLAAHWFSPTNTFPSYFNACANTTSFPMFGVPSNAPLGYQPARTGQAYATIGLYYNSTITDDFRIYIETELMEPLEQDTMYCVEFFVSLCGDYWDMCAVADVGMYLSLDSIGDTQQDTLSYQPQIASSHDAILIDTVNWMRINGTYTAQGGERYITIGNFLPNNQTNVVNTTGHEATYYIDDISVQRCSQVGVSANALVAKSKTLKLFPNPSNGIVQLEFDYHQGVSYTIVVTDKIGRVALDASLDHSKSLDVSSLPTGVYNLQLLQNHERVGNVKLVLMP